MIVTDEKNKKQKTYHTSTLVPKVETTLVKCPFSSHNTVLSDFNYYFIFHDQFLIIRIFYMQNIEPCNCDSLSGKISVFSATGCLCFSATTRPQRHFVHSTVM